MSVKATQKFPLWELLLFSRPRFNFWRVSTKGTDQDQSPLSKTHTSQNTAPDIGKESHPFH